MEEVKRIFKPEFINRIDEVMVFHPLNKENMKEIVSILVTLAAVLMRTKDLPRLLPPPPRRGCGLGCGVSG